MRGKWLLWLLLMPSLLYAAVYKWEDKQGSVHFSDRPRSGAEQVEVSEPQSYAPAELPTQPLPQQDVEEAAQRTYHLVAVTQPESEATIRNNYGALDVNINLEPALEPGDRVVLLLDGSPVGDPKQATSFHLEGIDPGTHDIAARVIDTNSQVVGESAPVTFYMHHFRVRPAEGGDGGGGGGPATG